MCDGGEEGGPGGKLEVVAELVTTAGVLSLVAGFILHTAG